MATRSRSEIHALSTRNPSSDFPVSYLLFIPAGVLVGLAHGLPGRARIVPIGAGSRVLAVLGLFGPEAGAGHLQDDGMVHDPVDGRGADTIAPAVVSNVIFMLDDFSEHNGGTQLVPGSHLAGRHPNTAMDAEVETIAAAGPAGTVLITDGRLWHGTGANTGQASRHGVLLTFCGPQFRPQENYTAGLHSTVRARLSDRSLALLGFKVWWAYGRTGDPNVDFIDPRDTPIGELRPH